MVFTLLRCEECYNVCCGLTQVWFFRTMIMMRRRSFICGTTCWCNESEAHLCVREPGARE